MEAMLRLDSAMRFCREIAGAMPEPTCMLWGQASEGACRCAQFTVCLACLLWESGLNGLTKWGF
eukprot:1331724-Prymnesium_polylepis.1